MADADPRPTSLDRRLRSAADTAGFALLWGWILIGLFYVPVRFGAWWLGVALLLLGLVVCYLAADATAYPVTTIGTRRRVDVETVDETGFDCDDCGRPAGGGERRRYAKERVCFGTVVARPESGANVYCRRCAGGEGADDPEVDETDGEATFEVERSGS